MFGKKRRNNVVIQTLIGEGTRVKGDVRFDGGCHVDGIVHGDISADRDPEAYLSISEDGLVEGNVRVPRIALNGKVQGDVFASDVVELGATAKVVGNVHYNVLEIAAGAEINGRLIHESAQVQQTAQKAVPVAKPVPDSAMDQTQAMPRPAAAKSTA